MNALEAAARTLEQTEPIEVIGRVAAVRGVTMLASDLPLPVGSMVRIAVESRLAGGGGSRSSLGEVVGFEGGRAVVMPLSGLEGVRPGHAVIGAGTARTVGVGGALLGRVIDAMGEPIDGAGPLHGLSPRPIDAPPLGPMDRRRIREPLWTGVRVLDVMATLGRGQRLGLFAGPGVGKSTLLGSIARGCAADVCVVGLIGERGREVKDFVQGVLGAQGLARSVVVASTSDQSPLLRIRGALAACAVAEHFRDQGRHVLLLMDSVTRFAQAHRQVGLAAGEPPTSKGYTPGVFSALARLLERAGAAESSQGAAGSITGLYTVLVEGDDATEPVSDAARGILDGHVMLSRGLAQRGHYPAVDVLDSVSRVADDVCDQGLVASRRMITRLLAAHRKIEDLLQVGAYVKGSAPEADAAIDLLPRINELLRQSPTHTADPAATRAEALRLATDAGQAIAARSGHPAAAGGRPGAGHDRAQTSRNTGR